MKKLFCIIILLSVYSCTNITHEMAEPPLLIPLPNTKLPVKIEDASNVENGFGTFGDLDGDGIGTVLRSDKGIAVNSTYYYNDSLKEIFDTGISGKLLDGKYLRIVDNNRNVMKDLGLEPISKRLLGVVIDVPARNQCYIDPVNGKFVLPRPCYWSKLETIDNITNAEIYEEYQKPLTYKTTDILIDSVYGFKFGNGLYRESRRYNSWAIPSPLPNTPAGTEEGYRYIYPFGFKNKNWNKGTLSVWVKSNVKSNANWVTQAHTTNKIGLLSITDNFQIYMYAYHNVAGNMISPPVGYNTINSEICLVINGETVQNHSLINNMLYHIYIIWDKDGLHDGKSVKIYANGEIVIDYSANNFPDLDSEQLYSYLYNYSYITDDMLIEGFAISETYLDNLKIWNHVASEDPSWEYNNINDNGLHEIYGSSQGYRPGEIKVGYY